MVKKKYHEAETKLEVLTICLFVVTGQMKLLRHGTLISRYGSTLLVIAAVLIVANQVRTTFNLGLSRFVPTDLSDSEVGYTKYQYNSRSKSKTPKPSVLIISTIATGGSYGEKRKFVDFLTSLNTITTNEYSFSYSFSFSSEPEFVEINSNFLTAYAPMIPAAVEKVTLMSAPFIEKTGGFDRKDRQKHDIQRKRRRLIARSRNFALLNSIGHEQYTIFVDADIHTFDDPGNFVKMFIDSKKDNVVPRVVKSGNDDYDRNSWRGERTVPNEDQMKLMDENKWDKFDYVPRDVPDKMFHFQNYVNNDGNERQLHQNDPGYTFELDSVGGAVLFAKSIVFKQGAIFPTSYIIGTTWQRQEGYDGVETEGLCYLAKPLGYSCWGLPNIIAHHADD